MIQPLGLGSAWFPHPSPWILTSFGRGVVEEIGPSDVSIDGGAIDDYIALFHGWYNELGKEEEGMDIGVEGLDPLFVGDVGDVLLNHLECRIIDLGQHQHESRLPGSESSILTRMLTVPISCDANSATFWLFSKVLRSALIKWHERPYFST